MWIEDSKSPLYNRHIRINHEPKSAWEIKAQMRQNDHPHSLKLFICHNKANKKLSAKPYAGSAIFFHIWRNKGNSATAGCTSMSEFHLRKMIAKIDPNKMPLYILLPDHELNLRRKAWKLP